MSDDIKLALKYLGLKESPNEEQLLMVESAMEEIKKVSRPLFLHRFYPLHFDGERYYVDVDLDLDYKSTYGLFSRKQSDSLCILVSTLGSAVDKRISRYKDTEPSRMVLLDACANSLIETVTDEYQAKLGLKDETFRYAPGYGDVPLTMQRQIFDLMPEISKIGIELDPCNMMHPFKSMTGLIGFKA